MSTALTKTDGAYGNYREAVAGALIGKEGHLVELVAEYTIQLVATVGKEFGTIDAVDPNTGDVTVRYLGAPGISLFMQGAAIAHNAKVKAAVGGKVVTAAATDRALGTKQAPATAGVNGDRIAVIACVEKL